MTTHIHQPRKRFGQNFLHDPSYITRIITAIAPTSQQHLVEIGPGLGAITTGLLQATTYLDVIEIDRDLITPLQERCAGLGTLKIYQADALNFNFCSLIAEPTTNKLRIVGNLPYNISTPLLFHLLDQAICIQDLHLLLQKEVVIRMVAPPGSKTYGRLSVMIQAVCDVQHLFNIGPGAFYPIPKVESSLVRLIPYAILPYPIVNLDIFASVVAMAFSKRRKTLRNALLPLVSDVTICACGLDGALRPEQLSVSDFITLANAVSTYMELSKNER